MKNRILALLMAFLVFSGAIPINKVQATENEKGVSIGWFNPISEVMEETDEVELFRGGEIYLTAMLGEDVSGDIQWQIEAGKKFWVDIQDGTMEDLRISYGMVQSLLKDDTVRMRCVVLGDEEYCSDPVAVVVTDEDNRTVTDTFNIPRTTVGVSYEDETVTIQATDEIVDEGMLLNAASETSTASEDVTYYTVTIEYVYGSGSKFVGQRVALPYIAEVASGDKLNETVASPSCVGYTPDISSIDLSTYDAITENKSLKVEYSPAEVSYTVRHYQQNVDDDEYTWVDTTMTTGYTEAMTSDDAAKTYTGFTALSHYHEEIAADSSTMIDIYYDRNYYLMSFELDGGYGVTPIYARYGALISVGTPSKAGYSFEGWVDEDGNSVTVPRNMPHMANDSVTYYAEWSPQDTEYSVAYWVNNDDGTKTYLTTRTVPAKSGSYVSGTDDICGTEAHAHTDGCRTCNEEEHTHTQSCFSGITFRSTFSDNNDMYAILAANNGSYDTEGIYFYFIQANNDATSNQYWCKLYFNGSYYNISIDESDPISSEKLKSVVEGDMIVSGSYDANDTIYYAYKYKVNSTYFTCEETEHSHNSFCYTCGITEHIHSDDCSPTIAQYLDFVSAEENVKVAGDGTTMLNVYYTYRTYTIRFVYAKTDGTNYYVASLTSDGSFENSQWGYSLGTDETNLPLVSDPSGSTERKTFTRAEDGYTYYYISLTAKLGSDISKLWPAANVGNVGGYYWGSWAAAPGTGYREKYGNEHANIVGVYPTMSTDMIADKQELLEIQEDGTKIYLAQNMIAWWADSSMNVANHAYHNYFEVIGETQDDDVEYNGKSYRLRETITFTAAHNGDTRVDPIKYNGFTCVNDTTGTESDKQKNSQNFANNGTCAICGTSCSYCNTFYYDAIEYNLKFYNYNEWLDDGEMVAYGTSLAKYESDNTTRAKAQYPERLEDGVYEFKGWYTTKECYDASKVDWETITMPDSDLVIYAKWAPITHEVKIYSTEGGTQLGDTIIVPHDEQIPKEVHPDISTLENPTDKGATFVGWFYRDANKEEQAFDFGNMTITDNITIYAKWRSNVMKQVEIYYVVENEEGTTQIADTETLMLRLGQTRTFEAKTGNSLYAEYRTGCFPTTASHSITITDADVESAEAVSYTFTYKKYGSVPYQVEFYVQEDADNDGELDLRPAYMVTEDGKAEFVDATTYANWSEQEKSDFANSNNSLTSGTDLEKGGQYIEQHWENDKAVVTELYVPDNLSDATWKLPDAYLPNALKIQKVIVPSATDPTTNIEANVIQFIYTYTESIVDPDPEDPNNPGQVYESKYLVQHYVQNVNYLTADDKTGLDEYELYSFSNEEGYSGKTATATPISIPGYKYSYEVTDEMKQDGTSLNKDTNEMSGTISAKDNLELNFYYTVNSYPYQVMYLEQDTNRVLAATKTTNAAGEILTGLYGSKVTETAIDLNGEDVVDEYKVVGESTKSIYIQMEAGDTASVNTIVFYYELKNADLIVSKTVALDPNQAKEQNIFTLPDSALEQEFEFNVYCPTGYNKSVYSYTLTTVTENEAGEEITTTVDDKMSTSDGYNLNFTLKHGQSIRIQDLIMGTYTVTETYVPGFRITVNGNTDAQQTESVSIDAKLVEGDQDVQVNFLNSYPFFTGELVLGKTVTKADENDPAASDSYKVTVVLKPDAATREVDREITWTDADNTERSITIPKLTGTNDETEFTFNVLVPVDKTITVSGVPAGAFTATETVKGTIGYISDFYTVKTYNKTHNNEDEIRDLGYSVDGVIHGGHPTTVTFNNTYKKGNLTIEKFVTQEYENDSWTGDTFTFTITGTTELPDGDYAITVNGNSASVNVSKGEVTFTGEITIAKTAGSTSWSGSLVYENLPAGYYTVTETAGLGMDKYNATTTTEPGTGLVNDTVTPAVFTFNNEYKRTTGNLQVSKEIVTVTTGAVIDEDQAFKFVVVPKDSILVGEYACKFYTTNKTPDTSDDTQISDKDNVLKPTSEGNLTFSLKHNQYIVIEGLPVGNYTVMEETVSGYQSSFTDVIHNPGNYSVDPAVITTNNTTTLNCQNAYPVYFSNLIVQKDVVTPEGNINVDKAPTDDVFTFKVVISDYSDMVDLNGSIAAWFYESTSDVPVQKSYTVTNNEFEFTLKAGEKVNLNIPACKYQISETGMSSSVNGNELGAHYTTTFTVDDVAGNSETKYEIVSGEIDYVTFTNTYKKHYANLTIESKNAVDAEQVFVYEVKNATTEDVYTVTITGNGQVTIYDLPLGEYTVTQKNNWSWRYEVTDSENVNIVKNITLEADKQKNEVVFEQIQTNNKWIGDNSNHLINCEKNIAEYIVIKEDDEDE